jgi:hypothetical protein
MEKKLISSEFDKRVIAVLRCIVPDQKLVLTGTDNINWFSECKSIEGMSIITIYKNNILVAKIVYDCQSEEEKEFIY